MWQEHPAQESSGSCRQFTCKYHGWRYGLDGKVAHVTNADEFFDLDLYELRMPPVRCEVFAGFIFINLTDDPAPLIEFLGDRISELDAYPFNLMTQRYGFSTRIKGNWKLAVDSVCEWYHPAYVHRLFIHPEAAKAEQMVPPVDAYHYDLFPPHQLTSVPGPPSPSASPAGQASGRLPATQRWIYKLFRAGLFGPDDVPDIGELPKFLNKGECRLLGERPVLAFPEPLGADLGAQLLHHLHVLAGVGWTRIFTRSTSILCLRRTQVIASRKNLVVDSVIEFAMQDVNTIEATHSALATRAQRQFHSSDQELLIRNFHRVIRDTVAAWTERKTDR